MGEQNIGNARDVQKTLTNRIDEDIHHISIAYVTYFISV